MRFFNGTLCVDAGRGEKLEALLDVVGFEGESLFDPVLQHGRCLRDHIVGGHQLNVVIY